MPTSQKGHHHKTTPAGEIEVRTIAAQPSWVIHTGQVELAVTQLGAHMAPVSFHRASGQPVQPYYISPWQGEGLAMPAPILEPLRGDFLCMPFGGNGTPWRGEQHPPHGEVSGMPWKLVGATRRAGLTTLTIACEPAVRPGRVTRRFSLIEGQNTLYLKTTIEGCAGPMPLGHHAILALPAREGSLLVSTSPFKFGMTCPHPFSVPESGEYQALAPGAEFSDLGSVPTIFKEPATADCTRYPARAGYCDLTGVFDEPVSAVGRPSWVTAVNTEENYLWFAFKDAAALPGRLFWTDNHGRHGSPWNGRNRCLGIEDVCSYFDKGVAESTAENVLNRRGIPTCHELNEGKGLELRYIQGVVKVPASFGRVASIKFEPGTATFISVTGQRASTPIHLDFIWDGQLD